MVEPLPFAELERTPAAVLVPNAPAAPLPAAPRLRADALSLPTAGSIAPPGAALLAEEAASLEALAGDPEAASSAEPGSTPPPEPGALRDPAQPSQALLPGDARTELPASPAPKAPAPAAPAPPADHERAGEILRQMRVQFSPELRTATIQLSPPELGRISIRVRVERGELHALVRAEKRATLEALERHVPELKATLEQLGIQARVFDLQLGFEQREARPDAHDPRARGGATDADEHDPLPRERAQLHRTLSARLGGIDTYA